MQKANSTKLLVFLALFAFRAFNSFVTVSIHHPDEYFQSVEVAHKLIFGRGILTWEWRPEFRLRSVIHPLYYALGYAFAAKVKCDLDIVSKLQDALISASTDYFTWRLANVLHQSDRIANWALVFSILSWYNFFIFPRSLSNCFEAAFFTAALYFWLRQSIFFSALAMGVATVTRVTSILPIAIHILLSIIRPPPFFRKSNFRVRSSSFFTIFLSPQRNLRRLRLCFGRFDFGVLFRTAIILCSVAAAFVLVLIFMDTWATRKMFNIDKLPIAFSPWNFLKINALNNLSAEFGVSSWYWYILAGIPAVLGPYILYFAFSYVFFYSTTPPRTNQLCFLSMTSQPSLRDLVYPEKKATDELTYYVQQRTVANQREEWLLWTDSFSAERIIAITFIFSILQHKESRFLMPIIPLLIIAAARTFVYTLNSLNMADPYYFFKSLFYKLRFNYSQPTLVLSGGILGPDVNYFETTTSTCVVCDIQGNVLNTTKTVKIQPGIPLNAPVMLKLLGFRIVKLCFLSINCIVIILSLCLSFYFSRVHESARINAAKWIRQDILNHKTEFVLNGSTDFSNHNYVFSMTNCYTVPGYSYFGKDTCFGQLTCDPKFADPNLPLSEPFFKIDYGSKNSSTSLGATIVRSALNNDAKFFHSVKQSLDEWNWNDRWEFNKPAFYIILWHEHFVHNGNDGILKNYKECGRFDEPFRTRIVVMCLNH